MDLSIIIPARNEEFLQKTIENILENIEGDTEVIAVLDGYWPNPPIPDNERIIIIHNTKSKGQRGSTNQGARLSQAKYIMKCDAHCAFDKGFDVKLMEDCQPDWTIIPIMYNLHAFNWKCLSCGEETYQGYELDKCDCGGTEFEKVIIWQPKRRWLTYSWRFDKDLRFQYWHKHRNRKETRRGRFIETMSFIGACWLMEREYYWKLDGCDEGHGSWGQMGTEWACKTWLSGGKLISDKRTWFAHLFRTGNFSKPGTSSWPYEIKQSEIDKARRYSNEFWRKGKWNKAIYPLSWLVEKFWPVPGWTEEDLLELKKEENASNND